MNDSRLASYWPSEEDEGLFKIHCSCKKWSFEGTAKEILKASREHDDAPWQKHIVSICIGDST